MRRYIIAAALTAALATIAQPASALAPAPESSPWPASTQPVVVHGHTVLPCVTTTWRAERWGQRKTPVGATCYATPDMWVSRCWPRVGTLYDAQGSARPVYLRTV